LDVVETEGVTVIIESLGEVSRWGRGFSIGKVTLVVEAINVTYVPDPSGQVSLSGKQHFEDNVFCSHTLPCYWLESNLL
jgi:hypothetical protein